MTSRSYAPDEPIAAIATALSPSALGVVRCSGKGCVQLVASVFSRPARLLEADGNTIVYGWIMERTAEPPRRLDEVLVSVFRAPRSFTGEDMVEISCHGGVNVVLSLFSLLLKNGFRRAEKGEFTFRAFINGKTDLTRAEAVREIIDAKTGEARSRAAGRLSGGLFGTIDALKKKIVAVLAEVEVEIEYPEDEGTISDTFDRSALEKIERELSDLAGSWKSEKVYQDGARVVLCGKTNAGKSSLFNALLKEERAIVSDVAGTTRDFLESWIDFDGIPVRLFDTAGLRETEDAVERRGVAIARNLSEEADLILYLVDSVAGFSAEDETFLGAHGENQPVLLVYAKADLGEKAVAGAERTGGVPAVSVSAQSGMGIAQLCTTVRQLLSRAESSDSMRSGLGSDRQKAAVSEALSCVRHALSSAGGGYALDAVVQDLEDALGFLGEVTGEVTPDDVLGSIFSRFCVGK